MVAAQGGVLGLKSKRSQNTDRHPAHLSLHHPLFPLHHHDVLNASTVSSLALLFCQLGFCFSFLPTPHLIPSSSTQPLPSSSYPHPTTKPCTCPHSFAPQILSIIPTSPLLPLPLLNPSHPSAVECRVGRLTWQHLKPQ